MKHILHKRLSVFIFLIPLVLASQNIKSNTRYLNDLLYLGTIVYTDTLYIESNNNDSLIFNVNSRQYPRKRFLQKGDSVYKIEGNKHILLYDYSLTAGDTFRLRAGTNDSADYLVDSVTSVKLLDNNFYRHWYLKSIEMNKMLTWIEYIGEKRKGWDYTEFKIRNLLAVCSDMQLIIFEANQYPPTCSFDSLSHKISVNSLKKEDLLLYPNPASDKLSWALQETIEFSIYNMQGSEIRNGIASGSLDISMLDKGNYILIIRKEGFIYSSVFTKT